MPEPATFLGTILLRFAQGLCEAAPTLIAGLFTAGYLRAMVAPEQLRQMFGAPGTSGIARSTVYGCLLPVCSMGVIPVLRELRRCGVPTSRLLSFALAAPLLNPITVIYGLTTLEVPVFALIIGVTLTVSFLVGWITGAWYEPPLRDAPEPPPHVAWGWRRMTNVVMATARTAAGPVWRDVAVALIAYGVSAACFPSRFLSEHLGYQNPEAPPVAAAAALFAYVAPAVGVMQISAIAAIQFSLGAAVAVHVFGVGLNAAVLAWVGRIYGARRLISLGLVLAAVTLGIGYAADAALPHPKGSEVDTYALDLYTRSRAVPSTVLTELQRTSLNAESPTARYAALASLGALAGLTLLGIGLRLAGTPLLSDPPEVNAAATEAAAPWNRPLPAPVLRLLGVGAVLGVLVQAAYIYYPPPSEIFDELANVRGDAVSALNTREWEVAERGLSLWDYQIAKLPMAAVLRGGAHDSDGPREVAEVRRLLDALRTAARAKREEDVIALIKDLQTASDRCRDCYLDSKDSGSRLLRGSL